MYVPPFVASTVEKPTMTSSSSLDNRSLWKDDTLLPFVSTNPLSKCVCVCLFLGALLEEQAASLPFVVVLSHKSHTPRNQFRMMDSDEKEAKVKAQQSKQVQRLATIFVVFAVIALFIGLQQEHPPFPESSVRAPPKTPLGPTEEALQARVDELDAKVREHKHKPSMIMETDPEGLKLTKTLQEATHKLLVKRYGRHTFRVQVDVVFPEIITKADGKDEEASFLIELAPIDLIPCSVYNFLEIARTWKSGAFHRNAGHVLQVMVTSDVKKSMPFQEYSPEFPHKQYTTGYAGRPSGPGWYVSILDNTQNHGPGSQQVRTCNSMILLVLCCCSS